MEANEARQMEMLLQEGGIADDGTTVDPVSGNEVPPGSMAEEVRDDVPAQLSEGEYVVPADVTRYYGVKFFEDLRTEAKQGMGQMEADGRIGGEPVSQTMDNQAEGALTPDELAMLQEMGMNVGGMVPPPKAVGNTTEYNKGGQVLYADAGVDVSTGKIDPYKAQYGTEIAANFGSGFLADSVLNQNKIKTVMLYSPDGISMALTLPAEQARYDQLLSEGYSTNPVATTTETTVGSTDDNTSSDDSPPPDAPPVAEMSDTQLTSAAKGLGLVGAIGYAVLGPVAGAALQAGTAARANAIRQESIKRDLPGAEDINYTGSIFGGQDSLYDNLKDTDGSKNVNFGDTWLGDLLGFDDDGFGVQGDGLKDSFKGSRRDTTGSTGSVSTDKVSTNNVSDDAYGPDPDAQPTKETPKASVVESTVYNSNPYGPDPEAGGPMNEGGIVKKRPKKKKKK